MSLEESLTERERIIENGLALTRETEDLFQRYGEGALASSRERFAKLEDSLSAKELRMVVVGEFSRGKSSLLNALLNFRQLPTASEATTAINTFIYGLRDPGAAPYMKIYYRDGREPLKVDIEPGKDEAIRRWGTELAKEHKEARREVEKIELFVSHPILDHSLTLIDTPGLESIEKHHEEITYRAIDGAHIAIWVQNTGQLGGNRQEWDFMKKTLSKNFHKFLTVVNWWDKVLEPEDPRDKEMSEAERVVEKMNKVRDNFRAYMPDLDPERLAALISDENLIGVSSKWALDGDESQKRRSGVDKLERRLIDIAVGPEALDAICYTPMTQLQNLQDKLLDYLNDRLETLTSSESLADRKRDADLLELEIKGMNQEIENINKGSKIDHDRLAKVSVDDIENELVEPLLDLKNKIEVTVTPEYIREQIEAGARTLNLPPALKKEYEKVSVDANKKWSALRDKITDRLEQLRLDYAETMDKYVGKINASLQGMSIELPPLEISQTLDLSEMERFYAQKMEIEREIENLELEKDNLEATLNASEGERAILERRAKEARDALDRAERRLDSLGSRPAPHTYTRRELIEEGGIYSSDVYGDVEYQDDSNVREYDRLRAEYESAVGNKEDTLKEIREKAATKEGKILNERQTLRRYEQNLEKMKAKMDRASRGMETAVSRTSSSARDALLAATAGQLDVFARQARKAAKAGVEQVFADQQNFLNICAREQFTERLEAKEKSRREAIELIEKGERELAAGKAEAEAGIEALRNVRERTAKILAGAGK